MPSLPTIFLSHGSPMLALQDSPARRFLQELGRSVPRPRAILVASAHWETAGGPAVSLAPQPATIHDFGGFPRALFESAGIATGRSGQRGLDHGAWVPLSLMYPEADLPVAQLSIVHGASPAEHERLGQALAALRSEGVLVIGSGSLTHNLHEFRGQGIDAPAPHWVSEFGAWMKARLEDGDRAALLDYRRSAPFAAQNHPTDEHLLPLYLALGAAGPGAQAVQLHSSVEHGVLAMDAYAFN